MPAFKPLKNVSQNCGDGVRYYDGKERFISKSMLKEIKSSVRTHEGEMLTGKAACKYMDKYSKKYLHKDLSGSYNDTHIEGYV
jgi:hypothetical protein